jgi:hypothetical protein
MDLPRPGASPWYEIVEVESPETGTGLPESYQPAPALTGSTST